MMAETRKVDLANEDPVRKVDNADRPGYSQISTTTHPGHYVVYGTGSRTGVAQVDEPIPIPPSSPSPDQFTPRNSWAIFNKEDCSA